jgi:hypothetical protein
MAVENVDRRGIGRDRFARTSGGTDECEADPVAETDRSRPILNDLLIVRIA